MQDGMIQIRMSVCTKTCHKKNGQCAERNESVQKNCGETFERTLRMCVPQEESKGEAICCRKESPMCCQSQKDWREDKREEKRRCGRDECACGSKDSERSQAFCVASGGDIDDERIQQKTETHSHFGLPF